MSLFPQVWLSVDGGNTFELLADFHNDIAKNSYHSYYTSDITFACQSGKVYLTKAGEKFASIGVSTACGPEIKRYMQSMLC